MSLGRPAYILPHCYGRVEMSLVMEVSVELWLHEEKQTIREEEFVFCEQWERSSDQRDEVETDFDTIKRG